MPAGTRPHPPSIRTDWPGSTSRAAAALPEAGDVAAAHEALDAAPTGGSVTGIWRCPHDQARRHDALCGLSWFRCRISDRGSELTFEKISGSQHMRGTLYPEGGGYVYLGASTVKGERSHDYSGHRRLDGRACDARRPDRHAHQDGQRRAARDALSAAGIDVRRDRDEAVILILPRKPGDDILPHDHHSAPRRRLRHRLHHGVRAPARLRAFRRALGGGRSIAR